jgi:putative transposase
MSQALSPTSARCYGLTRVARVWKISRASVYRSLKETPPNTSARRPGPVGAGSDAELADHIRQQIAASRLHGEGYRKLWARLRLAGVRASPRRVRRVMRENGLLAPHRVGRTEAKPHDGTIITDKVNEMWGTDITWNQGAWLPRTNRIDRCQRSIQLRHPCSSPGNILVFREN